MKTRLVLVLLTALYVANLAKEILNDMPSQFQLGSTTQVTASWSQGLCIWELNICMGRESFVLLNSNLFQSMESSPSQKNYQGAEY